MNKETKQEIKENWNNVKGKVKIGAICLLIGAFYGFAKGVSTTDKMTLALIDKIPNTPDDGDMDPEDKVVMLTLNNETKSEEEA